MSEPEGKDVGSLPWTCLICGKPVSTTHECRDGTHMQEIGSAVHFLAHGNWASSLWDPLDERLQIEMTICDDCLKPLMARIYVVRGHRRYVETLKMPWNEYEARETARYEALRAEQKRQHEGREAPPEGLQGGGEEQKAPGCP